MLQCVAMCCSVLQCVAVYCSVYVGGVYVEGVYAGVAEVVSVLVIPLCVCWSGLCFVNYFVLAGLCLEESRQDKLSLDYFVFAVFARMCVYTKNVFSTT